MNPPQAVTFDFWNTIVHEERDRSRPRRLEGWMGVLSGEGVALERQDLEVAFSEGWTAFEDHWRRNVIFRAEDAVDLAMARLGLKPPTAVRAALIEHLTDPPPEHDPPVTPNIVGCLEALRGAGVKIGIVCDVGLTPSRTLRRFLGDHGILHLFDHWSFSDEVGVFKPDPVIFAHALSGLGVDDPTAAVHVGDLRRTDVAGAQRSGMTAVRYHGVFDDPGRSTEDASVEADIVLADHADLPAALGIG